MRPGRHFAPGVRGGAVWQSMGRRARTSRGGAAERANHPVAPGAASDITLRVPANLRRAGRAGRGFGFVAPDARFRRTGGRIPAVASSLEAEQSRYVARNAKKELPRLQNCSKKWPNPGHRLRRAACRRQPPGLRPFAGTWGAFAAIRGEATRKSRSGL